MPQMCCQPGSIPGHSHIHWKLTLTWSVLYRYFRLMTSSLLSRCYINWYRHFFLFKILGVLAKLHFQYIASFTSYLFHCLLLKPFATWCFVSRIIFLFYCTCTDHRMNVKVLRFVAVWFFIEFFCYVDLCKWVVWVYYMRI